MPGWPVDVADALKTKGETFIARDQNERGALVIMDGMVYVPFGGHLGDCGSYHGRVVGISLKDPQSVVSWATGARGGGIWAPGGISTDGKSLFFASGNTFDSREWATERRFSGCPQIYAALRRSKILLPPQTGASSANRCRPRRQRPCAL